MPGNNRQIILTEKPQAELSLANFALAEADIPTPGDGEALVKTRYISLDAANRAWMQGVTYRSALNSGEVMAGGALAEVVESNDPSLAPGDIVSAETGWQEYAALPAKRMTKLPKLEPLTHLMSVYGVTGLTAYLGLLRVGDPQPGETVVVSAAAGAVGSIAAQVAKLKGARTIGIAGGAEKCAWADRRARARRGGRLQGRRGAPHAARPLPGRHRRLLR